MKNLAENDEEKSVYAFSVYFYLLVFWLLSKQHHHNCSDLRR